MLSTTSTTSGSASSVITAAARRSARARLVDVRVLRDARLAVLGLGGAVDAAVPPDRAAAALLVLERRALLLQLLEEGGDVGGVRLPEERHGAGEQRRTAKSSRRAPAARSGGDPSDVLAVAQERVRLARDPARELVEPLDADLERREGDAHGVEAVDVGDVERDPRRVVIGDDAHRALEV